MSAPVLIHLSQARNYLKLEISLFQTCPDLVNSYKSFNVIYYHPCSFILKTIIEIVQVSTFHLVTTLNKPHSFASPSILSVESHVTAVAIYPSRSPSSLSSTYFLLLRIWERSKSAENTRIALVGERNTFGHL